MIGPDRSDLVARLTEEARILGDARMLRDDEPYTPETGQCIIAKYQETVKRLGKSQEWASRSLGISPSTLSQVLSGTYAADPEKIMRSIDKWTEQQILKERAPRPAGYVADVGIAKQISAYAKWAVETGGIVLVHGPAGIGKTITALAVNAEIPGSIFISIRTAGQRKTAVLQSIAQAMRMGNYEMTGWQLFQRIEGYLKDSGRLLIVDEVHKLVGRQKDEALHCLRDLHDATGIPMLWLGMTNIANYIHNGHATGYEPLDQIHSRIGMWLDLTEVATGADGGGGLYTIEDIQKIITAGKMRITPDGTRYLQMMANEFGAGALRTVSKLLLLAVKYSTDKKTGEQKPIDAELLRGIQQRRLGIRAAEALEQRMELRLAKTA
jgi:DNA transposition AAA+ family ATPase